MTSLRLREAGPEDAEGVAGLHAASWRRHYRGAYADSFLDGDLVAERRAVWSARLAAPEGTATVVAEEDGGNGEMLGFAHVAFDRDERWGSLVDNLHVAYGRQRGGIGTALLARAGEAVVERAAGQAVYLWVLEQNAAAQRFYKALGGDQVERAPVTGGGDPSRLNGSPAKLRIAWPDARQLANSPGGRPRR
ncbi:GNAT family N-acetyltransferase [Streptomyces sp. 6N223]|uniref:GNAT family N-acetyltransferase n=1 Tax=Streptomyces sp. 6N223 TaxID=3457412 RepID=UPI003FD64B18